MSICRMYLRNVWLDKFRILFVMWCVVWRGDAGVQAKTERNGEEVGDGNGEQFTLHFSRKDVLHDESGWE